jgi:hypothetical protein
MGFNLFDFAMFFGAVSLVTAGSTIFRLIGREGAGGSPAPRLAALACLAILLTDLSDTARGEVGRMWMPFMPLLFVAAWSAPPLDRESPVLFSQRPRDAVVVGALMLVYCVTLRLHWSFW